MFQYSVAFTALPFVLFMQICLFEKERFENLIMQMVLSPLSNISVLYDDWLYTQPV